jgi:hypothetical protein
MLPSFAGLQINISGFTGIALHGKIFNSNVVNRCESGSIKGTWNKLLVSVFAAGSVGMLEKCKYIWNWS